jgi:hypothetical protein
VGGIAALSPEFGASTPRVRSRRHQGGNATNLIQWRDVQLVCLGSALVLELAHEHNMGNFTCYVALGEVKSGLTLNIQSL